MEKIKIAVAGGFGRMGQEVCKMIEKEERFCLSAIIDPRGRTREHIPVYPNVLQALQQPIDVLVDFTKPEFVFEHARIALEHNVRPVIGTTGLTLDEIAQLDKLAEEKEIGAVIAPNFAIGAVLMMKFAQTASKYLPHVEIIELHHDQKLDAPSGTALKTAEMIQSVRREQKQGHPQEKETLEGARGAYYSGFRIHSVRLPGYVAHQEVLFGDEGQILTIRHDSLHRSSFMPGVKLAIEKVMEANRLIYGLENILD